MFDSARNLKKRDLREVFGDNDVTESDRDLSLARMMTLYIQQETGDSEGGTGDRDERITGEDLNVAAR